MSKVFDSIEGYMEEVNSKALSTEVIPLVFSKQEGNYWDFKREWYNNKSDLLHDIICLANNLADHDAYIIIGIDQENDYKPQDIQSDPNRRNTQNIVDFLKDKHFAGGIRPVVFVQQLFVFSCTIDVVVIKNSHNTPFYLTEKYEKVNPNNIYTRVMDTNTPINMTADANHVEYLWRKRFFLDSSPLEKLTYYLRTPSYWETIPTVDGGKYYRFAPEFTIIDEPDDEGRTRLFFHYSQIDNNPRWYKIQLKYHQTVLLQLLGHALDGGRCFVVSPEIDGINFSQHLSWDLSYCYFIKDSCPYLLNSFFQQTEGYSIDPYSFQRFMDCVLVFESEEERLRFKEHVKHNKEKYDSLCKRDDLIRMLPFSSNSDSNISHYKKEFLDSLVLQTMLSDFRDE